MSACSYLHSSFRPDKLVLQRLVPEQQRASPSALPGRPAVLKAHTHTCTHTHTRAHTHAHTAAGQCEGKQSDWDKVTAASGS